MSVVKLHIVGFPYRKDIEGRVQEFLREAPGCAMTVRPQSGNDYDKRAMRAFDWRGRFVGYVSQTDLPEAWGALQSSGRASLRGMVTSTNVEHPCAIFECTVSSYAGPAEGLYPEEHFLNWAYSGPVLDMPEEHDSLLYMMDEISDRLDEIADWDDECMSNFLSLTQRFAEQSRYDISREMIDYRSRLISRLQATNVRELEEVTEELQMAAGRTGRETLDGGEVLHFWMSQIWSMANIKKLMVHSKRYDAARVETELEAFPESMYCEWQENRDNFIAKALYMHIPREVLWRFVSGIAFVEMIKGRMRLDHGIREIEMAGGGIAEVKGFFEDFLNYSDQVDKETIKGYLLMLNLYNIEHNHAYDEVVKAMYMKLGIKSTTLIQPKEYVSTKYVENEIQNVEAGGTGVVKRTNGY